MNAKHLKLVDQHWAVRATGLSPESLTQGDSESLQHLLLAYKVACIETSNNKTLRRQHQAAAWRALEIHSILPVSQSEARLETRLCDVLQVVALAGCGSHWRKLRQWMDANSSILWVPVVPGTQWDSYLLSQIYNCCIRIANTYCYPNTDVAENTRYIKELCNQLRIEQGIYEADYLSRVADSKASALRLIAMYHWVRATELFAQRQHPEIDRHYEAATQAAAASGDMSLEMVITWQRIAAWNMLEKS